MKFKIKNTSSAPTQETWVIDWKHGNNLVWIQQPGLPLKLVTNDYTEGV